MADHGRPTILLIGVNGQVGGALEPTLASVGSLVTTDRTQLDLTDIAAIRRVVRTIAPDVIVNAAAYTQVDRAESDATLAQQINADAPGILADEAKRLGALLVHYSTDYVFDGRSSVPYREEDSAHPRTVYGRTKHAGDVAVLASGARACIFRIGWVYGHRGQNFLRTIQRLAAAGGELRIVADQHGGPTWSGAIAEATTAVLRTLLHGDTPPCHPALAAIYHLAPPDATTWFDFAAAILASATPPASHSSLVAIRTAEYPTAAQRPAWSVLDATRLAQCFGVRLEPWRVQLARCVALRT